MPLLDRDTIIDRPVLVDRGEQDVEEGEVGEVSRVETLGEGGGPIVNNIEFREGDYDLVAASNLAAVLASGEDSGNLFTQAFVNSAFQLFELKEGGENIQPLVDMSEENGISTIGITEDQLDLLRSKENEGDEEEIENEESDEEDEQEDEEFEVEEEIEEIKEDGEETA